MDFGGCFFSGPPIRPPPPPPKLPPSVLIGKNANTTAATWNKIAVVDTWLNKTYLPKANQTGPLAGASSIAAQKANNAYKVQREREREERGGWAGGGRETSAPGGPCAGHREKACPIKKPPFPPPPFLAIRPPPTSTTPPLTRWCSPSRPRPT